MESIMAKMTKLGEFVVPGFAKMSVVNKPASEARSGVNLVAARAEVESELIRFGIRLGRGLSKISVIRFCGKPD